MILDFLLAMLWSFSPFGEAKVGIPYGMLNGLNIYAVFVFCFLANVLVFPMMMFFLDKINIYFIRWRFYKKSALFVARRAKTGSGDKIKKFGFLGLMLFVMIPLPGTGVYAGSIAAYLFKIERQKAFWANTTGIFFSSVIVWLATLASMKII
ncbi:small multi-drug export protein [Maribacter sp. PR1]|uniref:Small multi-drug export protein n=2 Tax=Flavobacteriaceae TaxID=49546 RepID=A0ABU7IR04_9FLAO|nr:MULTISPECIES: small multi-drug export protein [Maribacter]MDC6388007.1 small multi-drug export protein [Maribacter sp. PR1]MEE1975395.1 small multi-drug export protein [Maribacter cobaltidurans]